MLKKLSLILVVALLCSSCAKTSEFGDLGPSDALFGDGSTVCNDPNADWDNDGIPNGEEGCLTDRDSDMDATPDWRDADSDNDGILDGTEAGEKDSTGKCKNAKTSEKNWPCDMDGDGFDDYIDVDSDGDGLLDKDEDLNGDGLLGCCLNTCNSPDIKWQEANCILTADGCGPEQTCENGQCTPAIGFNCSNGETSPLAKDTFGDGKLDNERGTFICRDATEDKPQGRKQVNTFKNEDGDWNVALELTTKYGELSITNPGAKQVAAIFDDDDSQSEVAGFVVSRDTQIENIQDELSAIINSLHSDPPGGSGTITVRASGTERTTHDKFDGIHDTILDISLGGASNVSTVRNEIVATLLGKSPADLGNLPSPYGSSGADFVLRFVTVRRFDQKNPTDKSAWRLLVMGAVATKYNYQDPARRTGFIVDDLSNGTTLATASDSVVNECDVGIITSLPVADIIWVVDESGSMDDNRDDIVNNANNFFSRALASGLDFRMGVTNVCNPSGSYKYAIGKFCSKATTDQYDDGGTDRFLLPSEQSIFSACIRNPTGYEGGSEYGLVNAKEAVLKHLPRVSNTPDKIRPEAKLVLIIVTDELPNSLYSILGSTGNVCNLPANIQTSLNSALTEYLNLFSGVTNPEGASIVHLIGGVCNNACYADVAHGYKELAQNLGGQIGDVCQQDLGSTLQVIIDSIIGAASPVILEYVPISTSLAVALDGSQLERSRTTGFDYRASANSLAFINVVFDKGSEVIASYRRWKKQGIIE